MLEIELQIFLLRGNVLYNQRACEILILRSCLMSRLTHGCSQHEREGRRVGFTCGSFDLMHPGHAHYLSLARKRCDRLLVAVNSDASVRRYKSPLRPINPERDRMYVVAALESVDAVTLLDEDRPLSMLLRWKPDLYLKGGDYQASSLRSAKAVEEYGGRAEVIPSDFATSTTAMIERIAAIAAHRPEERLPAQSPRALALLDRDGTLIRDVPFLNDPERVELLPGVGEGLAELQEAGFALAIVTNQQGIGLGYLTRQQMIAVNQKLFRALAPLGSSFRGSTTVRTRRLSAAIAGNQGRQCYNARCGSSASLPGKRL